MLRVLSRLERSHGLVRSDGTRMRFDYPLLHEIVYQAVTPALREEIHGLLGDAAVPEEGAEAATPEAAIEAAAHYLRSGDPERALPLVDRALEHLEATGRAEELVDMAQRALELPTLEPAQRLPWTRLLAHRLQRLGDTDAAAALYREVVDLATSSDRPGLAAAALIGLGYIHVGANRLDEAQGRFEAALETLGSEGSVDARAQALGGLGQVHWHRGAYAEAEAAQRRVIELGRSTGHAVIEARGSGDLGVLLHETGRVEEAETLCRRALEILEAEGDLVNVAITVCNLGNALYDSGKELEALACYEDSLERARAQLLRGPEAVALLNIALLHIRFGETARAEAALRASLALCRYTGKRRVEGFVLHGLGHMEVFRGDGRAARTHLESALAIREDLADERGCGDTLQMLGAAQILAGDGQAAVASLDRAIEICQRTDEPNTEMFARLRRATITGEDGAPLAARMDEVRHLLRPSTLIEADYLLWLVTQDRRWLDSSKALLDAGAELLPEERRDGYYHGVRLHREIVDAS